MDDIIRKVNKKRRRIPVLQRELEGIQNMRHPVKGVAFLRFKGTLVGDVALLNNVKQSNYRGHSVRARELD